MKKFISALTLLVTLSSGQLFAQGIIFEKLSFQEALDKAKKEDKLIFIDFYTDWCAPCKAMLKNVFPQPEVGSVYNKLFVNLTINAEKEGAELAKKYEVNAFPNFVFLDGDGNVMYRSKGAQNAEKIIALAKNAEQSKYSGYSRTALDEMFDEKKNDEEFLKLYIQKMVKYGTSPAKGIEAWLGIQTEIKENYAEMMEFLFKYRDYLYLNGNAERILDENFDEYMDIATQFEEKSLSILKTEMARNTLNLAYAEKSPELMRLFITKYGKMKPTANFYLHEMDYCIFSGDIDKFKKLAVHNMDSIMHEKTIEQIHADDVKAYEELKAKGGSGFRYQADLMELKEGQDANKRVEGILKITANYLDYCKSKKEFKRLHSWIDFAIELKPNDAQILNRKSTILQQEGKIKEAIKYKEEAIASLSPKEALRSKKALEQQLEELKAEL